mgnify:CR=1 FL=1
MTDDVTMARDQPEGGYVKLAILLLLPSAVLIFMSGPEIPWFALSLLALTIQLPVFVRVFSAPWWTLSPGNQPDTLVGRLLNGRLDRSLRNVSWRAFYAAYLVCAASLIGHMLLFTLIVQLPALLCIELYQRLRGRPAPLPWPGVLLFCVTTVLVAALLSTPLRAALVALNFLVQDRNGMLDAFAGRQAALFDLWIGGAGAVAVPIWLGLDAFWRRRQATQVANLPRSKARSVSLGLVELQGIARLPKGAAKKAILKLRSDMDHYAAPEQKLRSFYLEDASGRIRVDPARCRIRAGWISDFAGLFRVHEVVLTRRVERNDADDSETRTLRDGDPVYVIGNAEVDPAAPADAVDSERLVIRPCAATSWSLAVWQAFFGPAALPSGRADHNVFFISDGTELAASEHILRGFRTVLSAGLACLSLSLWLCWSAQQRLPQGF